MPDQALLGFLKGSFVDQDISNNKTPRTKNRGIKDDEFIRVLRVEIIRKITRFSHFDMHNDDSLLKCGHQWLQRIKEDNELQLQDYQDQNGLNPGSQHILDLVRDKEDLKRAKNKARQRHKRGGKKKASGKKEKQEESDDCSVEVTSKENEEQLADLLSITPSNGLFNSNTEILSKMNSAIVFNIDCSSNNFDRTDMNAIVESLSARMQLKLVGLYDEDAGYCDEESWGSLDKFNEKDLYLNCLTEWKSNRWDEYYVDGACGFDS